MNLFPNQMAKKERNVTNMVSQTGDSRDIFIQRLHITGSKAAYPNTDKLDVPMYSKGLAEISQQK